MFLKRSYPGNLIDIDKVKFKSRQRTEKIKLKGVPFVVTYHPSLNCLHKNIKDNSYLLYMNEEVENLFLPGPNVSLSSYHVKTKLYPSHSKVGSKKCDKNCCEVCDFATDTDIFTSTMTGESFKINHLWWQMYHISHARNLRNNILEFPYWCISFITW